METELEQSTRPQSRHLVLKKPPKFCMFTAQLSLRYDFSLSTTKVQTIYKRNNTDLITEQQILNASILMHWLTRAKTA